MANATRAAVIGFAQSILQMDPNGGNTTQAVSDVQMLAREFLALRDEKIKVAGMFDNGPSRQGELVGQLIEAPSPPPSDTEVRLAALRTAADTYTPDSGVHGAPSDVIAMAYVYRAFLQGEHDAALTEHVTGGNSISLRQLVLGDK